MKYRIEVHFRAPKMLPSMQILGNLTFWNVISVVSVVGGEIRTSHTQPT